MRTPTKTERLLLGIFATMIVVLVLLLAWRTLERSLHGRRQADAALRVQATELRSWLDQRDLWAERGRWMEENPLPVWDRENSESELVQQLQRSVADSGIDIVNQRLIGTAEFPGFREISVQLTLRGTTEELVRWLHQIQQPGEYVAVRQLNLRADADKESLRAEVALVRHYREVDGSPPVIQVPPEDASDSPLPEQDQPTLSQDDTEPATTGESHEIAPEPELPPEQPRDSSPAPAQVQ